MAIKDVLFQNHPDVLIWVDFDYFCPLNTLSSQLGEKCDQCLDQSLYWFAVAPPHQPWQQYWRVGADSCCCFLTNEARGFSCGKAPALCWINKAKMKPPARIWGGVRASVLEARVSSVCFSVMLPAQKTTEHTQTDSEELTFIGELWALNKKTFSAQWLHLHFRYDYFSYRRTNRCKSGIFQHTSCSSPFSLDHWC